MKHKCMSISNGNWWEKSVEHGWIVQSKQARARLSAEKIIDVARERFISKGYAKTSISEIAVTAGASVGSIYQRFPEKKSLLLVIISRSHYLHRLELDRLKTVHESSLTTEEVIFRFVLRTSENLRKSYRLRRAFIEVSRSDDVAWRSRQDQCEYMGERLIDFIVNRGELPESSELRREGTYISKIILSSLDDLFEPNTPDSFSMNIVLMLKDLIMAFIRNHRQT